MINEQSCENHLSCPSGMLLYNVLFLWGVGKKKTRGLNVLTVGKNWKRPINIPLRGKMISPISNKNWQLYQKMSRRGETCRASRGRWGGECVPSSLRGKDAECRDGCWESGELRSQRCRRLGRWPTAPVLTDLAPRQEDEPCSGFIPGTQSFDSPSGFSLFTRFLWPYHKRKPRDVYLWQRRGLGRRGSQPCEFQGLMKLLLCSGSLPARNE